MLRVVVRLPSSRDVRRVSSKVAAQRERQRAADLSLSDKFNLASLNDGKNPFETSSERLLRSTTQETDHDHKTLKSVKEMKDVYSLDYLMGKKTAAPKPKTANSPFEVASAKLM